MKKIAPTLITAAACLYLGSYAYVMLFVIKAPGIVRVLTGIIGAIVLGVMVALIVTLKQRFKEIDEEDDDDLSQY